MSEQPPVPESKYAPLSLEEFQRLKAEMSTISTFLPEGQMRYIWEIVSRIRGGKPVPQPCACKSSAGQWVRAINELKEFVKQKDSE